MFSWKKRWRIDSICGIQQNLPVLIIINNKFYCCVFCRCARSVANWLPDKKQVEVLKISGVLSNFGFANKNGKFLYPEETLYLLEMVIKIKS